MKSSLHKVMQQIAYVLPDSTAGIDDEISGLDQNRRYSPRLYFNYFALLQGMARSDAQAVAARCASLRACLHSPYADSFEVREQIDDIAQAFLRAQYVATKSDANFQNFDAGADDVDSQIAIARCVATSARRHIAELETALATTEPHLADELASLVSVVQLMPDSFHAEAASSLSAFGMVVVRPPQQNLREAHQRFFYFDRVIHESAHIYLNMLMTFDPLVTNGATLALSPARQTLRPVKGVLHAHFVFFRLLHAYRHAPESIRNTDAPCPSPRDIAQLSLAGLPLSFAVRENVYFDKFMQGDAILRSSAHFTQRGACMLDSMREAVCHV
ncbi:HEXXH motif-containing putative peptide modification protein [Paraburkholderia sp. C35]|uniref:aKG-HExxH-type peptide beta-hydroxylase n=1 Tax=Paraburkholderia sp. C35 TaxID=2126993 RepID=UPI0013A599AB|nr:HEXXH motif-containing putative peptide modification protein [Paraburkholderia sp. C35]